MKNLNSLFLLLLILPMVSANGLKLVNDTWTINKTNNIDYSFTLVIQNQEPFDFYNITFEQNDLVTMSKIDKLESGKNISFQATYKGNYDFNDDIRILGEYETNIGNSNLTYPIQISNSGIDTCDLNIIQGDKITWSSSLVGEIKLKNMNTNEYFATIPSNQNYTQTFNEPTNFNYQVYKVGLPITEVCNINVQGTSGLVHNSNLDAILNISLKIVYEPTLIQVTFPTSNYSLDYSGEAQDIFTIKNIGNRLAKNIKVSGEWFSFDKNNFDLAEGQSINIGYTIRPTIMETNKTNITHIKNITIEGNFEKYQKPMGIFIRYFNFSLIFGGGYDEALMKSFVAFYCQTNPENCPYKVLYLNESNRNVTFTVNEESYREKILADEQRFQELADWMKLVGEKDTINADKLNSLEQEKNQSVQETAQLKDKLSEALDVGMFIGIILLSITAVAMVTYLIFRKRRMNQLNTIAKFHKEEQLW